MWKILPLKSSGHILGYSARSRLSEDEFIWLGPFFVAGYESEERCRVAAQAACDEAEQPARAVIDGFFVGTRSQFASLAEEKLNAVLKRFSAANNRPVSGTWPTETMFARKPEIAEWSGLLWPLHLPLLMYGAYRLFVAYA